MGPLSQLNQWVDKAKSVGGQSGEKAMEIRTLSCSFYSLTYVYIQD